MYESGVSREVDRRAGSEGLMGMRASSTRHPGHVLHVHTCSKPSTGDRILMILTMVQLFTVDPTSLA